MARNVVLAKYNSSGIAQWAQTVSAGSPESSFGSVAVDSAGNVHAAGYITGTGTYDFGNGVTATGTLNSGAFTGMAGPSYVVLVKYDSSGIAQWAQTVSGDPGSYCSSVAVDVSGSVYMAGSIDIYDLVRYDSSGIVQWAHSSAYGGSSSIHLASVTVNSTDGVYTAGSIDGAGVVDFGNNVATTGTDVPSALLVKYQ